MSSSIGSLIYKEDNVCYHGPRSRILHSCFFSFEQFDIFTVQCFYLCRVGFYEQNYGVIKEVWGSHCEALNLKDDLRTGWSSTDMASFLKPCHFTWQKFLKAVSFQSEGESSANISLFNLKLCRFGKDPIEISLHMVWSILIFFGFLWIGWLLSLESVWIRMGFWEYVSVCSGSDQFCDFPNQLKWLQHGLRLIEVAMVSALCKMYIDCIGGWVALFCVCS